jgi:hypothetical protein
MLDYDDEAVRWWMREVEHVVQRLQSDWKEVTAESVVRELIDVYGLQGTPPSDELHEMCKYYMKRYNDPFDGLGDVHSDLKGITEYGKNALLQAITAKIKLLKSHALELDSYIERLSQR